MKKLTNDEFLKRLKNKNIKYIPLEEYQGYEVKIKWACLKNTKHIFEATPLNVFGGRGCPYCSHHKVFVGETDMWTTNPKMASMLKDPEDGYKYTENSTHRLYWKCLDCGNILFKSPNTIFRQGLSCDVCSDGISYAERYMISILNQLNIKYLHDVATNWSNGKRYDFYIESLNLIVETHGLQHYEDSFNFKNPKKNNRSLLEEIENDEYKKQIAINNGINDYIQLDCRVSNGEYIKKSILDSSLSDVFDLSNIDWYKCDVDSVKSLVCEIAQCWNNGIYDIQKLSEMFGLHKGTVRDYLKRANDVGLCDYNKNLTKQEGVKKSSLAKWKTVRCIETGKIYSPIKSVELDGFSSKHISSACKGERETVGGYHWEYVS